MWKNILYLGITADTLHARNIDDKFQNNDVTIHVYIAAVKGISWFTSCIAI